MSKTNIPAGGWPVTKAKAAGTAFGLRDGAEEPRQKPAAWAGKEEKYEPSQYHSRRLPCNRSGAGGHCPVQPPQADRRGGLHLPLVLCDNDLDRDHECFTDAALEKLAVLFRGKDRHF